MENKNSERIIFVKDLLFAVLYQWRKLLIVVLIAAIALGLYAYGSQTVSTASTPDDVQQQAIAAYEKEKAVIDQKIKNLTAQIDSQGNYITTAPLMQLDPYALFRVYLDYTVQTDYQIQPDKAYQDIDPIYMLSQAYCNTVSEAAFMNTAAEIMDAPVKYVSDLVSVNNTVATTRSFKIVITAATQEQAQALCNAAVSALRDTHERMQAIAPHTLEQINAAIREVTDTVLADSQAAAMTRLDNLKISLAAQQAQANGLVRPVFVTNTQRDLKKVAVFAIVGGVLGFFLVAAWACLRHISGDRVYSARTLYCCTKVKILGCTAKHETCFLDRWLHKLEGRTVNEDHTAAVMANVRNYCADAKRLLVTGSCEADAEATAQALKELGIDAAFCGNLLSSADALKDLRSYDAVLLVTTCGCSRYSSVCQTLSCLKDLDIKLVGCVVVGG